MGFSHLDLFDLDATLTEEERAVRATVRRFVDDMCIPPMAAAYRDGRFPRETVKGIAALGLLGATLGDSGSPHMGPRAYWLALQELERADSGLRSFASVQSSLVMFPIFTFGSPTQHARYLPALRSASMIGCFGLTEPDAGSDPGAMRTRAIKTAKGWHITGTKRWITNGTIADVAVVWARTGDDAASIRGFLVDKGTPGFQQLTIEKKQSFRASDTGELILDDVIVPDDAILPKSSGLGSALKCLFEARAGISFAVLGAAAACLDVAVDFAKNRVAFGRPIAATQLVQHKLANMALELSKAQLVAFRVADLKAQGTLTPAQVSAAKMSNVKVALDIARTCRDILGANGITDEYPVMRHMANLETVFTYEGTHDIHALVLGQAITGTAAFR